MNRIISAVLIFFIIKVAAQEYNFKKFSTEDGLSLSQTSAITQHPNGTIIIGIYGGGVDFYDGNSFQNIGVKNGLSSNLVYSLQLTNDNVLWVGTAKGLDSYSSNGKVIKRNFKELTENIIWDFLYYQNILWICSNNGIFYLEHDSLHTVVKDVRAFAAIGNDSTILFATNKGLISVNKNKEYKILEKFKDRFIITLLKSSDDTIFLGTNEGLITYKNGHSKTYTSNDGLINNKIYSLKEDHRGNIWIGTEKGLDQFNNGKFKIYNNSSGINEYRIWKIFEDNSNQIWFATDGGLYYMHDDNFKLYRTHNERPLDVWSITELDNVLFGTHNSGVLKFENNSFKNFLTNPELNERIVRSLQVDKQNNVIYIGTDRGIFTHNFNDRNNTKIEFPENQLNYDVINVFKDSESVLWLSTLFNGIFKLDTNNQLYQYTEADKASLNAACKIVEAKNNTLWLATENGIIKYSKNKFSQVKSLESLDALEVLALQKQNDSTLWAGVYSYGVVQINISDVDNPKIVRTITTNDGLNDNSILAITIDGNKLWVGTNFGLNLVDLDLLSKSKHFVKAFSKYNGLPGLEFVQNSIYRENEKSIWFGTIKGIINFDPTKVEVATVYPNIYISKFVVKNQDNELGYIKNPLSFAFLDEDINLDHKQNNISIEYKSTSFPVAENIKYQYRLGSDSWSKATSENSVNFYNLPPKDYVFEVRSIKDGVISQKIAKIKFTIATPFWLSSWFYISLLTMLLIVFYSAYVYRVKLLRAKNKELQRRIVERKKYQEQLEIWQKELIAAKKIAEKSDRLKSEFLAQMSHEIRTPINSIRTFSYLLKESLAEKVEPDLKEAFSIIDRGGKRLIRTIDSILNMSQIQVGSFETRIEKLNMIDLLQGLYLEFKQSIEDKGLIFNMIFNCKKPFVEADEYTSTQIFANLIDNAFKYTPSGKIVVTVYNSDENQLVVSIEDTGIGISEEKLETVFHPFSQEESGYTRKYEGVGLGLALVKKYCELNNAVIRVKSKKGTGTTFTVIYKLSQ